MGCGCTAELCEGIYHARTWRSQSTCAAQGHLTSSSGTSKAILQASKTQMGRDGNSLKERRAPMLVFGKHNMTILCFTFFFSGTGV
jgi:hypothetical protein